MKQFIETICIREGKPQHLEWHQRRVDATLSHFYPHHQHTWHLAECIDVPSGLCEGDAKCRILYDAHHFEVHHESYEPREISTLRIVEAPPDLEYNYKYADRAALEDLYSKRADSDDILISKDGWITDTSIANIAFMVNDRWYTPSAPLLAGTTWKRLVFERILIPKPINLEEIINFDAFKVFNALHNFDAIKASPVGNIK